MNSKINGRRKIKVPRDTNSLLQTWPPPKRASRLQQENLNRRRIEQEQNQTRNITKNKKKPSSLTSSSHWHPVFHSSHLTEVLREKQKRSKSPEERHKVIPWALLYLEPEDGVATFQRAQPLLLLINVRHAAADMRRQGPDAPSPAGGTTPRWFSPVSGI